MMMERDKEIYHGNLTDYHRMAWKSLGEENGLTYFEETEVYGMSEGE